MAALAAGLNMHNLPSLQQVHCSYQFLKLDERTEEARLDNSIDLSVLEQQLFIFLRFLQHHKHPQLPLPHCPTDNSMNQKKSIQACVDAHFL